MLFASLALGVLIAASAWTLALLAERAFVFGLPLAVSLAGAAAVAATIAVGRTLLRRSDSLSAAIALDRAAGLKERVSSALALARSSDPFAQAVVRDAGRVAAGVHVPAHVPLRSPRLAPWSLSVVALAGLAYGLMPKLNLLAAVREERQEEEAARLEHQNIQVAIRDQLKRVEARASENPGLERLMDDLKALEIPDEPTRTPEDVRREAIKRIDSVTDALERKKQNENVAAFEELQKQLQKLDTPNGDDPASKLAKALSEGDNQAAKQALADLKKQLENAAEAGDEPAKAKLREMQAKLENLSAQLAKLGEMQKLQKDLENKAGLTEEQAKQLLERLSKMDPAQLEQELKKRLGESGLSEQQIKEMAKKMMQQQKAMMECKSLASAMAQAAAACQQAQQGDGGSPAAAQAAAQALDGAMGQLSEMEMAEQMMNELQAQLSDLDKLREGVCQGGFGNCAGQPGDNVGGQGANPGLGYGERVGRQRVAHQYQATKVDANTGQGQIIGQMLIDGPQLRGEATADAQEAVGAALRDATDAIERQQVPRQYERVLRDYFESLAGLARGKVEDE
jgi:hypothetical protein